MIEFFFWQECPSYERALADLRAAMAELDIDEAELTVVDVTDEQQARRHRFPGSPTIRIGGADVQDPGDQPYGLTCRLYRLRDGRPSPLPDPADVRDALAAMTAPTNDRSQ